jgi:hypothetical protein
MNIDPAGKIPYPAEAIPMPPVGGWAEGNRPTETIPTTTLGDLPDLDIDKAMAGWPPAPEANAAANRREPAQFINDRVNRLTTRYNKWANGIVRRNPEISRPRLDVLAGIAGALATLASVKLGPNVVEHAAAALQPNASIKDMGSYVLLATGAVYATGRSYLNSARREAARRR